ncbi:unnamed protein product [Adineta steineri]|uniref:Uncharacterized protein n=1 Tax=Adineta steineri TaxID=433720 RepID=A0A814V208_9BILA|nr:unnamed protein product [Adineta steineri]CAF4025088.1 unnamed protein product [Adineta steineri]
MHRQIIILAMLVTILIITLGPMTVMSVDPKVCYMWDKCRGEHMAQGAQIVFWECGGVPAGCVFKGKK